MDGGCQMAGDAASGVDSAMTLLPRTPDFVPRLAPVTDCP